MLREKTENFIEKANELKTSLIKEVSVNVFDLCTDENDSLLYRKMFGLFDDAMELICEQAKTLDDINTKLDRLLEETES